LDNGKVVFVGQYGLPDDPRFCGTYNSQTYKIYTLNADRLDGLSLVYGGAINGECPTSNFDNLDSFSPSWSPDQTKLAIDGVDVDPGNPYGRKRGIFTINLDGSNKTRLTTAPIDRYDFHLAPAWSPDGTKIAYTSVTHIPGTSSVFSSLNVIAPNGSNPDVLTTINVLDQSQQYDGAYSRISWSPDGSRIAYIDNGSIWTVDVARKLSTILVSSAGNCYRNPSYSMDGRFIAAVRSLVDEFGSCTLQYAQTDCFNADGSLYQRSWTHGFIVSWSPSNDPYVGPDFFTSGLRNGGGIQGFHFFSPQNAFIVTGWGGEAQRAPVYQPIQQPTLTPTITLTPSIVFTPSKTLIPSKTVKPSNTPILTRTIRPSPTRTPTVPSLTPTSIVSGRLCFPKSLNNDSLMRYRDPVSGSPAFPQRFIVQRTTALRIDSYAADEIENVLWLHVANPAEYSEPTPTFQFGDPTSSWYGWVKVISPNGLGAVENPVTHSPILVPIRNSRAGYNALQLSMSDIQSCINNIAATYAPKVLPILPNVAWQGSGSIVNSFTFFPLAVNRVCDASSNKEIWGLEYYNADLYGNTGGYHIGVDFFAPDGSTVYSIANNGIVVGIGESKAWSTPTDPNKQTYSVQVSDGSWGAAYVENSQTDTWGYSVMDRTMSFSDISKR